MSRNRPTQGAGLSNFLTNSDGMLEPVPEEEKTENQDVDPAIGIDGPIIKIEEDPESAY